MVKSARFDHGEGGPRCTPNRGPFGEFDGRKHFGTVVKSARFDHGVSPTERNFGTIISASFGGLVHFGTVVKSCRFEHGVSPTGRDFGTVSFRRVLTAGNTVILSNRAELTMGFHRPSGISGPYHFGEF